MYYNVYLFVVIAFKSMIIYNSVTGIVQKGGCWGLKPLPFFKNIQKCPSQTNNNDIVVNKTKCIWIIINMAIWTKQ